jgi:hypothetical protein
MKYIKNNLDSFIEYKNGYSNNSIENIISLYKNNLSLNIISSNTNNNLLVLENLLNVIMNSIEPKPEQSNTVYRDNNITDELQFPQLSKFHMINVNSKMETFLNNNLKYNGKKVNTELNLFQLNYNDELEGISNIKLILIDFKKLKFTEQKYYFLILEYLFTLNHLDETKYKLVILHFDTILKEFVSKLKYFIEKNNVQVITINKYRISCCPGFFTNIPLKISKDKILKYYLDSFCNNYIILKNNCYNIFTNIHELCSVDIIKIDMLYTEFISFCIKRKLIKKKSNTTKVIKQKCTSTTPKLTSSDICYYEFEFIGYLINNKEPKFIFIKLCYELISLLSLNIVLDYLICNNTGINLTTLQKCKIVKLYYFNIEKIKQIALTTGVFFHSMELYVSTLQLFVSWYIKLCNNSFNDYMSNTETIKNYLDTILLNQNYNSTKFIIQIINNYSEHTSKCDMYNIVSLLTEKIKNKYKNIYKPNFFESNNKNIDNKFNLFYYNVIHNLL